MSDDTPSLADRLDAWDRIIDTANPTTAWQRAKDDLRAAAARLRDLEADNQRLRYRLGRARQWMMCPEHGPICGHHRCCCTDRHIPGEEADQMIALGDPS